MVGLLYVMSRYFVRKQPLISGAGRPVKGGRGAEGALGGSQISGHPFFVLKEKVTPESLVF